MPSPGRARAVDDDDLIRRPQVLPQAAMTDAQKSCTTLLAQCMWTISTNQRQGAHYRARTATSPSCPGGEDMETLVIASELSAAFVAVIVVLFVYTRRRASTAAESDSSDDETPGSLSVNVVADHDEKDALLPTFAGLLRSPWHGVAAGQKEQPKMMRTVRKGSRSLSLTIPLPLRKKKEPAEVPTKKVHVPYFFPLLDETAEWWQTQQAAEPQPTPEEEPETGHSNENASCKQDKEMPTAQTLAKEQLQSEWPHRFPAAEIAPASIEVGGR